MNNKNSLIIPNPKNLQFPFELEEGKSVQVYTDKKEIILEIKNNINITYAWFRDQTGKVWRTKFKFKNG